MWMTMHFIYSVSVIAEFSAPSWCGIQSFFVLRAYYKASFSAKITKENIKYISRQLLEELPLQFLSSLILELFERLSL